MKTFARIFAIALIPAGAALAQGVADLDSDGDGVLSLAELQAAYPVLTEDGFASIDANADGVVDDAELTAAVEGGALQ